MFGPSRPRKKVTFHSPVITEAEPELEPNLEPEYPDPSEDGGDIDSTCVEVGTSDDDDNDSERDELVPPVEERDKCTRRQGKMSTTDESSDAAPEWTREEDRIICVMKSEAKSWAEIGKELERGKKECQQRHRTLASHARELGITTEKLARLYVDEDEDDEEEAAAAKSKSKKSSKAKDKDRGKSKGKSKSKARDGKGEDKLEKSAAKTSPNANTKSKRKKEKNKKVASDTGSDSDDEEEEEEEEEEGGEREAEDPEAEYWAQRRYIYDTLYGTMYPDRKTLHPDRFYSESDCRVLAGLEARYRANKWLYIQAEFCNATGRMVEAEILRAKFYEDQN
ncbi:hypothetical protein F5Y14DRAFT_464995 [Nemania sp. NC0429]|nr:hypothetical protein F5Y14DRAFT_464995 [Nemania sp. NC0429]